MTHAPRPGRNDGLSFIELIVAVALLGLAVVGTMPLLWATVRGSTLQDNFAGARSWLVSAGDYAVSPSLPRMACTSSPSSTSDIINTYQTALQTAPDLDADRPPAPWTPSRLTVTAVQFWNGTSFTSTCFEPTLPDLRMQQISLRVSSPDGTVTETLDVVKDVVKSD